jgi:hypothetical protein
MSKIRNTPHVYTPSTKHLGIQWYPGNAEGWHSPSMTLVEKDRVRAAVESGNHA